MRITRLLLFGSLAVLAAVPGLSQPVDRQAVVATVEGEFDVTAEDLAKRAERIFYRGVLDQSEQYRIALQEATLRYLKGLDFFRLGFDRDSAFAASLGPRLAEELLIAYYERNYEAPYLNEQAIRDQHEAMGRVVTYRQIVLRKPPNATPAALAALRSTVAEIRRQLDDGVPMDALVARYSQDAASARNGGRMPPVTWAESTRSPLDAVVFQLEPGEAASAEARGAFFVLVGESVGEQPVPPLAEAQDQIVETLRGRYAEQANQAYYDERQALVDSASVRWNDDVLEEVLEWVRTPGFFDGDYRETIDAYLAAEGDTTVFIDSAGQLRISELPRLISEVLTISGAGNHAREFVQDYLLEAVRADRMVDLALALGLRDKLVQPGTSSPVLASAFVRYYDQKRIEARIPEPSEPALRAFYEAHADSLFYQPATVYTEVIERKSEAEIDEVWAQIESGVPFEDASNRLLRRSFERMRDGEIAARFIQEPPYLGEVAFEMAADEVVGPVSYDTPAGRRYAIVRATRWLDERQLPFEEVRDRVAEAFIDHHRARLTAEVEAELRSRYDVEVDEALWARVLGRSQ